MNIFAQKNRGARKKGIFSLKSQRQISPNGRKSRPHTGEKSARHSQKKKAPDISAANLSQRKKKPSPLGGKERQPQPKKESAGHLSGKSPIGRKAVPARGKRAPAIAKRQHRTSQRQISPSGRKSRPHTREKSASHSKDEVPDILSL